MKPDGRRRGKDPVVLRSSGMAAVPILLFSLLILVVSVVVPFAPMSLPTEFALAVPIGAVVVGSLALLGVVLAARSIADDSPRLVIDDEGVLDYRNRAGPRRIAWATVHSADYESTTVNGSIQRARFNFYVVGDDGQVEEVKVGIAGLDRKPK